MKQRFAVFLPALAFLAFWQWTCEGSREREFLFATPALLFTAAAEDLPQWGFWRQVGFTVFEALAGLFAGTVAGSLAGLLLWINRPLARIAKPYLVLFGSIPVFAVAPLFIVWFGTGVFSKCVMAACGVFFIALHHAFDGAESCSRELSVYLRGLGASSATVLGKVVLPGAWCSIVSGLRLNIGFAFLGAFVGELVSSEAGLGHYILRASSLYDMPRVFLGVAVMSLTAVTLSTALTLLSRPASYEAR